MQKKGVLKLEGRQRGQWFLRFGEEGAFNSEYVNVITTLFVVRIEIGIKMAKFSSNTIYRVHEHLRYHSHKRFFENIYEEVVLY